MSQRPSWLRIVDGGAGPSTPDGVSPARRPAIRRPPAPRIESGTAPARLPWPATEAAEPEPRWNTSLLWKWAPAVLACSVLSGAMLWNLGRLWLERSGDTHMAERPASIFVTVPNAEPYTKAPATNAPKLPARASEAAPVCSEAFDPLAAMSFLAFRPEMASEKAAGPTTEAEKPSAPAKATAPKADRSTTCARPTAGIDTQAKEPQVDRTPSQPREIHHEIDVHVVKSNPEGMEFGIDVAGFAGLHDVSALLESLPAEVQREVLKELSREIRDAYVQGVLRPQAAAFVKPVPRPEPPAGPDMGPGMGPETGNVRVAEIPVPDTAEGERRLILYQEGGQLRVRLQRLTAPALPAS